jgi:hypothetical protein
VEAPLRKRAGGRTLGERRLALRRAALVSAPDELACSLRELVDLYTFECDVLDPHRVEELHRELDALPEGAGPGRRPDAWPASF